MSKADMLEIAKAELRKYDDSQDKPSRKLETLLISVIIPVYNGEKYIIQAIDSVIAQTYPNLELIIVIDGSVDNTDEVITTQYARKQIGNIKEMQILRKPNGGTASALNMGIKHSRGEYIKWLSADDVMHPQALTDLVYFAVEDYSSLARSSIFYTDYDIIDAEGNIIGEFKEPARARTREAIVNELFTRFFGNASTSLIHKNIFTRCGMFDESLPHSEDYEFWLRATALYDIMLVHIPVKTIKYRRHLDQLTGKVGGQLDEQIKNAIRNKLLQKA